MPTKIFISHAAADEQLAGALVNCILTSMVLDDSDLRCTSVPGHKLPLGADFAQTLMDDIGDSSVVVGLITPAALTSSWVLFELGATWGAKKNLKPLVADSVDFKALPGPLSGRHAAKISNRSDVAQFIEEIATTIGAKRRTAAKIDRAIEQLLAAHTEVMKTSSKKSNQKIETKQTEPLFSGMPFSELVQVLLNENIVVPSKLAGDKGDINISLLEMFLNNYQAISNGLQDNATGSTGFLYRELGLRLLPYGLTQFDKLPAAQARYFKRIVVSPEGHKFLLQHKRGLAASK